MAMLFEEAVRLADLKSVAIGSFLRGQNWWVSHMQSAKAAITTMSHTMAKEWAEYGIRVCNVAPVSTRRIPKFFAVFCRSTQWWLGRAPSLTRRRT